MIKLYVDNIQVIVLKYFNGYAYIHIYRIEEKKKNSFA